MVLVTSLCKKNLSLRLTSVILEVNCLVRLLRFTKQLCYEMEQDLLLIF